MHISKLSYQPIFGTSYRKVYVPDKTFLLDHEASTCFYKSDFQWNKGTDFFIDFYKNTDSVNVYSLAASDCSEALSLAMILDTKLGKDAEKFFPIIAVDNDPEAFTNIMNGYIDLASDDEVRINHYTGNKLNKYLKRTNYSHLSDAIGGTNKRKFLARFEINPELLRKIKIQIADVRDYVKIMPDKDNWINCRNMWVYLHPNQREFLEQLSKKADKNSFLINGDYDFIICPLSFKNEFGFSMHPELLNVYDKSGSNYFDDMRWLNRNRFTDY